MNWLRRTERVEPPTAPAPERTVPGRVERVMPGLSALLDGVSPDRTHSVLDLGPAADSSLQVYSRFARWVRFADLLSPSISESEWAATLESLPEHPRRPYDLVFAWNVFDRLGPAERDRLVARLVELTDPDARLHVIVDSGREGLKHPLRFALLDTDRICYEHAGPPLPTGESLLPAELERLVEPFHVTRAFTTRIGLREYVAFRGQR